MHGKWRIFLLTYMVAVAIPVSLAFNIDMRNPEVHTGEEADFYGYKVHQFNSGNDKGIIVTAPLQKNGTGGICKTGTEDCFNPEDISIKNTTIPVKHFGLSIAADPTRPNFTACSPNVAHECDENSFLNSVCYTMTYDLQIISSFNPAFQECTKKTVDLVFLFDGSESMTTAEFNKNKDFIVDIIKSLKNTSIKFAAAQFSTEIRTVFDFNDDPAGRAHDKLMREPHMRGLTNTHRALNFVLKEILENPDAGSTLDSTKVVVIITDGDPTDTDKHFKIIKQYDDKNIIRFVIGVKDAKLDKFRAIASEPKDKNAFKIENYDGLTGILGNFQNKIFNMEGTSVALAGDLTDEMAQSGFSAVFYKDTLILGAVGSNNWRGSLNEYHEQEQTKIEDPQMGNASYLGYSVSVGVKNNAPLYFTGAPRFNHTGMVVLLKHNGTQWITAQNITGDQIGSYFGAELCSVDVNSDGNTDFLLVGAPLFYQPQVEREGQIYIYNLTEEMEGKSVLNVTAPTMGRFGTTISSLADLNGDGLRDIAVGAPLEDDNGGVVYIYLGDRRTGIRSDYSQRIMGKKIRPGMRFFGQAIDGNIDLEDDGLPDIVIGSQGNAIVLRSRPVFNIMAHLSFQPKEISTDKFVCPSNPDKNFPMINLTACFEMIETTKSKGGAMTSGLTIKYMLDVDPMREKYRGFFSPTDKKSRNVTNTHMLSAKKTCFDFTIYMPECVKDTLSPISIKLNFSQADSENANVVLNVDSKKQAQVEVPFEKHCRKNDTCIAELGVDFDFATETLLVSEENYFNLSVTLSNYGDDSFNTTLSMFYPLGLSFSRMVLTEKQRAVLFECRGEEGVLDKTTCSISRPVYRRGSTSTFKVSFHVRNDYEWNEIVPVTITGESENANSTSVQTKTIPVQFEIKMAAMVKEDTTTYLNFTPEADVPKRMVSKYKLENPGWKSFPVNVSLVFPTKLEHNFEMTNYHVLVVKNKTKCTRLTDWSADCPPETQCKAILCDTFILDKESSTEFELSGNVQFKDLRKHVENIAFLKLYTGDGAGVKFQSSIQIEYDKKRYLLDSYKQENKDGEEKRKGSVIIRKSEVRVEFSIPPNRMVIILTGCVLGFLLLIIIIVIMFKLGCFKLTKSNKLKNDLEQDKEAANQEPPAEAAAPTNGVASHSETDAKSDPSLEEKKPLCEGDSVQPE